MMSGSSSGPAGDELAVGIFRGGECVTTAHSIAKPSTCAASFVEERLRDEQREVRVDVAGVLEAPVEVALDRLPDARSPRGG